MRADLHRLIESPQVFYHLKQIIYIYKFTNK